MTRMPQVTARDLVRFLKSQGFAEHRQSVDLPGSEADKYRLSEGDLLFNESRLDALTAALLRRDFRGEP